MNFVASTDDLVTPLAEPVQVSYAAALPTTVLRRGAASVPVVGEVIAPDGVFNRILTAALINRRFRQMLLSNPSAALAAGYRGETFPLSAAEREIILGVRATTLTDFARALLVAIALYNQRATAPEQP